MVMHVARVEGLARGRAHEAAGQDWGIGPPRSTGVRKRIEDRYNRRRRHSSLGQITPVDFELQYSQQIADLQKAA
jgi:hypothetical protein